MQHLLFTVIRRKYKLFQVNAINRNSNAIYQDQMQSISRIFSQVKHHISRGNDFNTSPMPLPKQLHFRVRNLNAKITLKYHPYWCMLEKRSRFDDANFDTSSVMATPWSITVRTAFCGMFVLYVVSGDFAQLPSFYPIFPPFVRWQFTWLAL